MPFGSYEASNEEAIHNAQRFVKEAGCDAVKLGTRGHHGRARTGHHRGRHPGVMGHVGLTPQTATALGGYRSQAARRSGLWAVIHDAVALQEAGCFAIVFEAIPSKLTELVMPRMRAPVIGIGAGPAADGQVLVFHDLLGIYDGHAARFVKRYANVRDEMVRGVGAFAKEVRERRYPAPEHTHRWPRTRSSAARGARAAGRRALHRRLQPLSAAPARAGKAGVVSATLGKGGAG